MINALNTNTNTHRHTDTLTIISNQDINRIMRWATEILNKDKD